MENSTTCIPIKKDIEKEILKTQEEVDAYIEEVKEELKKKKDAA